MRAPARQQPEGLGEAGLRFDGVEVVVGAGHCVNGAGDAGLLQSEDHPESAATTYLYDAKGHVLEKKTGTTVALQYDYDPAERLEQVYRRLLEDPQEPARRDAPPPPTALPHR